MSSTSGLISLRDRDALDRSIAGNKATTLAFLMSLGYPVPEGIVVAADSSDEAVSAVIEALDHEGLAAPWAVRSSSTVEDGTAAAFPGVFRTVLGVTGEAKLLSAIRAVRASSDSDLARRYMAARGIESMEVGMAVLIQSQLRPRAAGVAFSRDPVTGEDHVGIEANYGLGETVVDGSVSPDYIVVDRSSTITVRTVGTKKVRADQASGQLTREPVSGPDRLRAAISDEEAVQIAELTRNVEKELGAPQDIEWALDGTLHLLQARPITTGGENR